MQSGKTQTTLCVMPLNTALNVPISLRSLDFESGLSCQCSLKSCAGWESVTETEWPSAQMQAVGTLRDPDVHEPTFEEHHPNGTRYDSPDAPIAVKHFPYNRCDLFTCTRCKQHVLRYTEFGGYYVDHRARRLDKTLICDPTDTLE